MNKNQIINKDYFDNLPNYFTSDLPNKISIKSKFDSKVSELYNLKLIEWVKHYFSNVIENEDSLLTQQIELSYTTNNNSDLSLDINFAITSTNLEIEDVGSDRFIQLPYNNFHEPNKMLIEPLVQLSIILTDYDIEGALKVLIKCIEANKNTRFTPEIILSIGTKTISNGNIHMLQEFIESLITNGKYQEFQFLNMLILSSNDIKSTEYYQSNLSKVIELTEDIGLKGILSYNLANSYRSTSDFHLASRFYQKARKFEPDYLNRPYWWYEYGGVLFLSNHFKIAESFYKKSKDLGIESIHGNLIWALIGDCLFYQCEFEDAKKYYEIYIENHDSTPDENFIKYDVCRNMILVGLGGTKPNLDASNELTKKAIENSDIEGFSEAIGKNPLNALAWFNYGISLDKESKTKQAFIAFLTTCAIQEWDIEAWSNCFFIAWNLGKMEKMVIFYDIILKKFGLESVNYIANRILDHPNMDQKTKSELIDQFKEMANQINNSTQQRL